MNPKAVKGTKKLTSANTLTNAVSFMVRQALGDTVNTAEVVSINSAEQSGTEGAAGYAAATPLVCQTDAFDNILRPVSIPKMPFFRPQAGKAAIVMDPQPGDKAILVAMKRDSSGVKSGKNDPVHPGSYRSFDMADGYLINGFLGEAPEIWLHLNPVSGDISLSTKAANIEISCRESGDIDISTRAGNVSIRTDSGDTSERATGEILKKAPLITLDGNVHITGSVWWDGESYGRDGGPAVFSRGIINRSGGIANAGGINNSGGIENSGGVTTSNGVTVETHTHKGVLSGGSNTGSPNTGS